VNTLSQILSRGRTLCRAPGTSQKRLFQTIAQLISADQPSLPTGEVFNRLIAREKLGSTALGEGIAIPHCRVETCVAPVGCLVTLADPVDFNAPDDRPVDLLFALLVPEGSDQQHLDTLAGLARLFQQEAFCRRLRAAQDAAELFRIATDWES
jgi:PTS system nitrogen regulatory IIA component